MQRIVRQRNALKANDVQGFKRFNGVLLSILKIRTPSIPPLKLIKLIKLFEETDVFRQKGGTLYSMQSIKPR